MADTRSQFQESTRVWVMARDSAGAGVTGATIVIAIRRDVDSYWWNGTSRVFQSAYTTNSMTQGDSTNLSGLYYYDFLPNVTDFSAVFYATTGTAGVVNDPFIGDIIIGRWVDDIDSNISSRSPETATTSIISHLGTSFVDSDIFKLHGLLRTLEDDVKKGFEKLDKKIGQFAAASKLK